MEIQSRAKAFFKAKWFPSAVSALALVIAIGGHGFTALNSVGYVKSANRIESLEAAQAATQRADGSQDRAIQVLNAEQSKSQRAIQILQAENAELRKQLAEPHSQSKSAPAGFEPVNREALQRAEIAKKENRPLANGVNERFDNLVRTRMQPFFEEPPRRPGAESMDDEDVVVLQFAVDRAGMISDVQVANTSGQIEFDNSAVKAALRMGSIPEIARLNDQAYAQVKAFRLAINPAQMKPAT
uniref:TonB C-terminal domain-containing protein n=1 Tax=Pseudomonas fluorescens (strain SBW25) TaxID=216595 RepID=A0A0G4E5A2_PSEFS|nr:hypothetical protein PQBR57_0184 [Pseudomonas fluorescens SBW25]